VQVDEAVEGTPEELQVVRAEAKAGKVTLQRGQVQLIAENVLAAVTRRDKELSNPAGSKGHSKRAAAALTAGEKMGDKGLLLCQQLRVSPQLLASDGNWTLHYAKYAASYARAVLIHKRLLQPNGPAPPVEDVRDERVSADAAFGDNLPTPPPKSPRTVPVVPAVVTDHEKHWHCLRVLEFIFSIKYAEFKGGPTKLAGVQLVPWGDLDESVTANRKVPESNHAAILKLSRAGKACLLMVCSEKSQRLDLLQRYGCTPTDLDRIRAAIVYNQVFLRDVLKVTNLALQHLGLEVYGEARPGSVLGNKAHAAWLVRFQWMKPSDVDLEGRRAVKSVPAPLLKHPRSVASSEDSWPGNWLPWVCLGGRKWNVLVGVRVSRYS
jgi:hypothetical protein